MVKTSQEALDFVHQCCAKQLNEEYKPQPPKLTAPRPPKTSCDYSHWDKFLVEAEEEEEGRPTEATAATAPFGGCAHDRSQERQIYEKPTEEKLKAAEKFCEIGNCHVGKEEYKEAALAYRKGEIQLDYTFPDNPGDEERMRKLKLRIHLNAALSALQMRDWDRCSTECYQALQIDSKNAKAHYRKGKMFLQQDLFEKASEEFRLALESSPGDPGIIAAQRELLDKEKKYKSRAKVVARKAMNH